MVKNIKNDNPFSDQLAKCECCPHKCRINRLKGKVGLCKIGADIQISHAGLHFGEEPPISGTNGSGTLFFTGCNLACVFCQNYQISQEFRQSLPRIFTMEELCAEMLYLQAKGAHNINFVSPSHMIFQMADAIKIAKNKGLTIPVVYNSNGYDSIASLRQIQGLVDIYLPDIKYLENNLGKRFSAIDDYADIVPDVIREMFHQVGHLTMDHDGIAVKGLLIRHLVLPNHLENTSKCLQFVANLSQETFVSIMSQYSPQHNASDYPEINRPLTQIEYETIIDDALNLGLENAFIQELESQDHYLPDFTQESPFE